jgi:hypothetical protein
MSTRTRELAAQLSEDRERLVHSVSQLSAAGRAALSWRAQMDEHPVRTLGVALGVGAVAGIATSAVSNKRLANELTLVGERVVRNSTLVPAVEWALTRILDHAATHVRQLFRAP